MKCLKCGTQIEQGQVFCGHCLEGMADCPVKPGTPIHLPHPTEDIPVKKAPRRRKILSPEEWQGLLQKLVLILTALVVVLSILLGISVSAITRTKRALRDARNTGRNYMVVSIDEP